MSRNLNVDKRWPFLLGGAWLVLLVAMIYCFGKGLCEAFDLRFGLLALPELLETLAEYPMDNGGAARFYLISLLAIAYCVTLILSVLSALSLPRKILSLTEDSPSGREYRIDAATTLTAISGKVKTAAARIYAYPCLVGIVGGVAPTESALLELGILLVALALLELMTVRYAERQSSRALRLSLGLVLTVVLVFFAIFSLWNTRLDLRVDAVLTALRAIDPSAPAAVLIPSLYLAGGAAIVAFLLACALTSLLRGALVGRRRLRKKAAHLFFAALLFVVVTLALSAYTGGLADLETFALLAFRYAVILLAVLLLWLCTVLGTPKKKEAEPPYVAAYAQRAHTLD